MRLTAIAGVLAMIVLGLAGTAKAQDAQMGAEVFHRCAVCHEIGPEAVNRQGPVLNELFGRIAGTAPEFRYSDAMMAQNIAVVEVSPATRGRKTVPGSPRRPRFG